MEAARRLTTTPDATNDQMQADIAMLAPYIAAQAMAAAFPARPPGGPTQGNGPPQPNTQEGQAQPAPNNNNGIPPLPPFFFGLAPLFFGGGNTEAPADPKRAERLAGGLKVVEDGLLKRWKAVCGDEGAVCAVCYGELLEEPGIESEEKEEEKNKSEEEAAEPKPDLDADEHERNLLEALKRREEMERLEEQERARKLETAVLAFPCGHVFHRTCLLPWLSRHTTCPTCRFDIDPKSDTLVLPAEDELPPFPFMGGPNGLNFGDYFTVGPVLRVPRAHIPGFVQRRGRPAAEGQGQPTGEGNHPAREGSQPAGEGNQPGEGGHQQTGEADQADGQGNQPNRGDAPRDGQPTPAGARSAAELFDALLGSILAAGVGAPPRPPRQRQEGANTRQGQEGMNTDQEREANPEAATTAPSAPQVPLPASPVESPGQPTPADSPAPAQEASSSTAPSSTTPNPSTSNAHPEIQARTLDYDRPMAMFGRPSPRRPPQPITPAWMRAPRPANAPALRIVPNDPSPGTTTSADSAPTPRSVSESTPRSTPTLSAPRSVSGSRPASSSSSSPIAGLGQLRAIVSNLIPQSIAPVVTSPTSLGGTTPTSHNATSPTTPRGSMTSPIFSPREGGLRAMLHGPAALLRDLTAPSTSQNDTNDMPGLETDSETFSEDDAHQSEQESEPEDLPALEPIDESTRGGRRPPAPAPEPVTQPEPETQPAPAAAPPSQQTPPRPENTMDNIITLRIDLGHADGRDETIIVPLLFNPLGRGDQNRPANEQNRPANEQNRPANEPRRVRTPPPPKKWTPPEPIKTFRQVVEEKEREAGWRCDDPACLLGPADDEEPSDEHPIKPMYSIMRPIGPEEPVRYKIEDGIRVYAGGEDVRVKGENPVCSHMLHPECLVTSARVNGWGPDPNKGYKRVTLRCPVCRSEGTVERQVWDAGVQAEE
ncbi:hypothetical protein OPQ81_011601 [Rhizoctonia solani]|nr:hypothetical protein OPQ81_011601 [Rhizoctonia solani]